MSELTPEDISSLAKTAKQHWLAIEKWRLAYEANRTKYESVGNTLKGCTIVSGIVTGGSSVFPQLTILTAIAGAITGVIALADRIYTPERKAQDYWTAFKKLEELQRRIDSRVQRLNQAKSADQEFIFLDQVLDKISDATNVSALTDAYRPQAERNFESFGFDLPTPDKPPMLDQQLDESDEGMEELSYEGVTLVTPSGGPQNAN